MRPLSGVVKQMTNWIPTESWSNLASLWSNHMDTNRKCWLWRKDRPTRWKLCLRATDIMFLFIPFAILVYYVHTSYRTENFSKLKTIANNKHKIWWWCWKNPSWRTMLEVQPQKVDGTGFINIVFSPIISIKYCFNVSSF